MRFVVLGSGTGLSDPKRGPAGFLLQVGGTSWLIDGGSGTLQRCARAGCRPEELTGGFYSHRHPDHCADLVPLLFAQRIDGRTQPYPIWAAEGFSDYLKALRAVYGKWMEPSGGVEVHEISPRGRQTCVVQDGLTLVTAPAQHSAGGLHLRFETPTATVVFSGDTGPSESLIELSRGADLLVCECAGSDEEPVAGHLTPSDIAQLAQAARPRAIWLTHFYPQVDEGLALSTVRASGVSTRRAEDGDVWAP